MGGPLPRALRPLIAGCVLCSSLAGATPVLCAQAPPPDSTRAFTFRGNVRDYVTEGPIPGAVVAFAELNRSVVTDANGYFELTGLMPGRYTIVTEGLGYETNREPSDIPFGAIMVVRLNPLPIELPGVEVNVERLLRRIEVRRLATPMSSTAFANEILEATVDNDVAEFVGERTSLEIMQDNFGQPLVRFRGRITRLRVCLDEVPVDAGFLQNLQPQQLSRIEVFESLRMVRMYTKRFIDEAAERGFELLPINLATSQGC